MTELFDRKLRALRRDRAARSGADPFLLERAFDECVDTRFGRTSVRIRLTARTALTSVSGDASRTSCGTR